MIEILTTNLDGKRTGNYIVRLQKIGNSSCLRMWFWDTLDQTQESVKPSVEAMLNVMQFAKTYPTRLEYDNETLYVDPFVRRSRE